ncbi:helix-turn-helix domain-containing protein [Teichococcus oryzae]|uniref:Helix-turn-helix domain-containing protein n=1 Tax=Teichococcus oryzae TaxID=1608942 RepID=A0A5B2T9M7_9PROT|nr:helix-turn-helix domain-containing protein [Pseudoroseomonas oryzae]KAA2211357.1 helix-turn-helix domain-containing protein [Pseudoroseomonas oryzae]
MTDPSPGAAPNASASALPRLLTLAQVCEITALSPSTLRRQIRLRRLAVLRFGSMLRIAEADLRAWLARQRRPAR